MTHVGSLGVGFINSACLTVAICIAAMRRRNFMSRTVLLLDFHASALNPCHQGGAAFNNRE
jgi:hypothetical protein